MTRWVIVVMMCLGSFAHADGIQSKGEMFFLVPLKDGGWDQGWVGTPLPGAHVGPIKRARDSKDNPTLTIFVINADGAGTPAEIEAKLPKLVAVDGVEVDGAKPSQIVLGKGTEEKLTKVRVGYGSDALQGEATLRMSAATINGKAAVIAIVSFETQTNILVGVLASDAAKPLFESIVRGVSISRQVKRKPKAPVLPDVRPIAVVKELVMSEKPPKGEQPYLFAWCGEATITFARPVELKRLDLGKSKLTFNVSLDGGKDITKRGAEAIDIKREVTTVKLAIDKGNAKTCASVRFTDPDGWEMVLVRGFEAAAIDALPAAITAIQTALFEDGGKLLEPVLAFPFSVRAHTARKPTVHKSLASVVKACAKEQDVACPASGYAQTGSGAFLEPTVLADGRLELRFPAGYQATEEDLWRLAWKDGAWKLVAVDYRTKERGPEGMPQP